MWIICTLKYDVCNKAWAKYEIGKDEWWNRKEYFKKTILTVLSCVPTSECSAAMNTPGCGCGSAAVRLLKGDVRRLRVRRQKFKCLRSLPYGNFNTWRPQMPPQSVLVVEYNIGDLGSQVPLINWLLNAFSGFCSFFFWKPKKRTRGSLCLFAWPNW